MIDSNIFKAYDIRGIYPREINEEAAYKTGRAFASFIEKASEKENPKIVLSRDNRNSSLNLFNEVKRGLIDQGADVVEIGLSTTPMFYFSVAHYGFDGGLNITASHNPKQYNGFKLVREKAIPISGDTGIEEIKNEVLRENFVNPERKGVAVLKDPEPDYIKMNGGGRAFKERIVVDTGNSVSGIVIEDMLVNAELTHIFSQLDGDFPNHEPDPLKEENTVKLREEVVKKKADLGVAFDGDGDRVFFIDEKGDVVPSDLMLALASSILLRSSHGLRILYDVRCSNIVRETVESLKGEAVMSRVGHSFIKAEMRAKDIALGGEYSGHYYAKFEGGYFFEGPFLVLFLVLEEMERTGERLSSLILPFRKYFHSGELNFKVSDKKKIIKEAEEKYKEGSVSKLDGLRVDFNDWWFSLRASNTEPLLRLIVEAKTREMMEEKIKEIKGIIEK